MAAISEIMRFNGDSLAFLFFLDNTIDKSGYCQHCMEIIHNILMRLFLQRDKIKHDNYHVLLIVFRHPECILIRPFHFNTTSFSEQLQFV